MKKILAILLIAVFLMATPVHASVMDCGMAYVTGDPTVNLGQTITFTVCIRDAQQVQSVMLEPVYDTQAFELVTGTMLQTGLMADFNGADGVVAWSEPTLPNGDIMTFTLKPKDNVQPDSTFVIGCKYTVRDSSGTLYNGISIGSELTVICAHTYEQSRCTICGKSEFAARVGQTGYKTVQEAVEMAQGSYVTLLEDSLESVTCPGDLYLDLNGFALQELTVGGFLYGMDSSTADYDCADGYGVIRSYGGTYTSVNITGSKQRYIALEQAEGLSFHRVYVGVTHMSLRGSKMEFGFKVAAYGDQVIKSYLTDYGFRLWTREDNKVRRNYTAENFSTGLAGNVMTARVANILTPFATDEENAQAVLTNITVECYMSLDLGDRVLTLTSQPITSNLKNLLTAVNATTDQYTAEQMLTLKELAETYRAPLALAGCKLDNIEAWTQ